MRLCLINSRRVYSCFCYTNLPLMDTKHSSFFRNFLTPGGVILSRSRARGRGGGGTLGNSEAQPIWPPRFGTGQDWNGGSKNESFAFRLWIRVYFDCPWWSPLPYLSLTFTRTSSNKMWPQILQKMSWWSDEKVWKSKQSFELRLYVMLHCWNFSSNVTRHILIDVLVRRITYFAQIRLR